MHDPRVVPSSIARRGTRVVARTALGLIIIGQLLTGLAAFGAPPLAQSPLPTSPAQGSNSTREPANKNATFGVQPSGAKKPDGRGYFSLSATPGARVTDHIAINNYSLQPLKLTLQTSDALNTLEGDFALLPADQPSKEVGTWITLPAPRLKVVVPARGVRIVEFKVAIPPNATPGDHAGGITATLESVATSSTGQKFRLLQTVGSRVFVRVSGPLRPVLAVEGLAVRYSGTLNPIGRGYAVVTYTIRNTGNVALGGRQSVRVSGLLGLGASAVRVPELGVLLPRFSVRESVEIRGVVPQIWMSANVSIKPLVLPGSVQGVKAPFTAGAHFWAVPWVLLGMIAFAVAARRWRIQQGGRTPLRDAPGLTTLQLRRLKEALGSRLQAEQQPLEPARKGGGERDASTQSLTSELSKD